MKQNSHQIDPIAAFVEQAAESIGLKPASLIDVSVDIEIRSGLVAASVTRTFRNLGDAPIEALLSFPTPVGAVFYELTADIDGRQSLKGIVRAREAAREQYEEAISDGHATVLHEEFVTGIHMLSVGNLGCGESARVTICWVDSLYAEGTVARYRVPMTLGDVYGLSGLVETDVPALGGAIQAAEISVKHDGGKIMVNGVMAGELPDGDTFQVNVPNNVPVEMRLLGWKSDCVHGRSRDGRDLRVEFQPHSSHSAVEARALDVAVLVDVSGSMANAIVGTGKRPKSKHVAVGSALRQLAAQVERLDRVSLWEFASECRHVGAYEGTSSMKEGRATLAALVHQISQPGGGSEVGRALESSEESGNRDVLLITDGLSHALDVQGHTKRGHRVIVMLVGEDSLESRVAQLAALTGGALFYSFGGDVRLALTAALRYMRTPRLHPLNPDRNSDGPTTHVRGGAEVTPFWGGGATSIAAEPFEQHHVEHVGPREPAASAETSRIERAVGALVAGIEFSRAESEDAARKLAVSEGLVSHLTSLVLVDQGGTPQDLAPAQEKVRLPFPRTSIARMMSARAGTRLSDDAQLAAPAPAWPLPEHPVPEVRQWLQTTASRIGWTKFRADLEEVRLDNLPLRFAAAIWVLARHRLVIDFSRTGHPGYRTDPERLAIALVAASVAYRSASAAKLCESLLGGDRLDEFRAFATRFFNQTRCNFEQQTEPFAP